MTEAKIEQIKNDYLQGMKYNDIKQKYNITQAELRSIVYKYKLTRTKSKAQMGNKNALGNKGGTGAEILREQGVSDHHPALHPHLGSAQLRPAHQFLRAEGQGQRSLHGLGNRICQAQPPAGT